MFRDQQPIVVNGAKQSRLHAATKPHRGDDWKSRLSGGRPTYECPTCRREAMQFYATLAEQPDRSDFFHCHACGTCWEI